MANENCCDYFFRTKPLFDLLILKSMLINEVHVVNLHNNLQYISIIWCQTQFIDTRRQLFWTFLFIRLNYWRWLWQWTRIWISVEPSDIKQMKYVSTHLYPGVKGQRSDFFFFTNFYIWSFHLRSCLNSFIPKHFHIIYQIKLWCTEIQDFTYPDLTEPQEHEEYSDVFSYLRVIFLDTGHAIVTYRNIL